MQSSIHLQRGPQLCTRAHVEHVGITPKTPTPFLTRRDPFPQHLHHRRPRHNAIVIIPHANRSPNPYRRSDSDDDDDGPTVGEVLDLALPAFAGLAILAIAGPIFISGAALFGLPIVAVGLAGALGLLDPIAAVLGIDIVLASGLVGAGVLGILLIPTFLKIGFFAFAAFVIANFVFGQGGLLGPKEPELDPKDATIDVDWTTIDADDGGNKRKR